MKLQRIRALVVGASAALLLTAAPAVRAQDAPATIVVRLPADARLVVDGDETRQRGEVRRFHSPPLAPGRTFRYNLEAIWTRDGKTVRRTQVARVRAGEETVVDFTVEDRRADTPAVDKPPSAEKPRAEQPPPATPPVDKPRTARPPADNPPADKSRREKPAETRRAEPSQPAGDVNREPDVVFVPTPPEVVDKMLELANVKKDDVVYDLGCGDGRIVVAAAKKYGCRAVGVDIDPREVQDAQENVRKNGVGDLVTIRRQDMFAVDLSKATVVTLYLLPSLNIKLIPQLQKMKPGSRILSHAFAMEGYKPKKEVTVTDKEGDHKIYLWVTPLEKE
jgi:uncharacterized protein (TIGR03000 family)